MTSQFERNNTANAIRGIRKILRGSEPLPYPISPLSEQEEGSWEGFIQCGFWLSWVLLICCLLSSCDHAFAEESLEIPSKLAIRTIVGEASNQGYTGMVAVAEVIRHKGSLRGFYGLNASHSAHEPKWVWLQARKAWLSSASTNLTHGADHFENIHAFGCPYWVSKCIETFRWKEHVFYKEIV